MKTRPLYLVSLLSAAGAIAMLSAPAQAAYTITGFGPAAWGSSDAALGLQTAVMIEDFEDVQLIPGLRIEISNSSAGAYGPTGILPATFSPAADDPYGNAFDLGVWDGSRVLLNTGTNQSHNYASFSAWGDVTFLFSAGATQVGFSLQQMSYNANLYINGSLAGTVAPTLAVSGGRLGYLRIDVTGGSAPITSLRIDGASPDAWTIDHLAVMAPVPEPDGWALMLAGLGVTGLIARRRLSV